MVTTVEYASAPGPGIPPPSEFAVGAAVSGAPRGPRPHRRALLAVSVAIMAAAVLMAGYAGIAPWSPIMPFGRPTPAGSPLAPSYSGAESVGAAFLASRLSTMWEPVQAVGVAMTTPWTVPTANISNGSVPGSGCPGSSTRTYVASVTLPAASAALAPGLAPAWVLEFVNGTGDFASVAVVNGTATLLATMVPGTCTYGPPSIHPIPNGVIDSTQSAAIADAWGGTAFRANATHLNALYVLMGPISELIPPCCPPTGNGSGGTFYPPNTTGPNLTSPSVWEIAYSVCPLTASVACGPTAGFFSAVVNALNGSVLSVFAIFGAGVLGVPYGINSPPILAPGVPPAPKSHLLA